MPKYSLKGASSNRKFFLDKKAANNKIKFILPNGIGHHVVRDDIDASLLKKVLKIFTASVE